MKLTVVQTWLEDAPQILEDFISPHAMVEEALEYAYRWTNNVMGSWSRKEEVFDNGHANGDLNDNVVVKAPLHEGGMGLRSTSVGDMMHVDGRSFEVARMGFQELI